MRLVLGPPPDSLSTSDLANGEWHRLRELPVWAFQIAALAVGAAFAFIVLVGWIGLTPPFELEFADAAPVVAMTLAIIAMGTLLQVVALPDMGCSSETVLGFWPSRFIPYTAYTGKLTKGRYLLQLWLPFLLLALAPLLFVLVSRVQSGWLIFISCFSAFAFGSYVAVAISAAIQVPANTEIGGIRFQTYWRVRN